MLLINNYCTKTLERHFVLNERMSSDCNIDRAISKTSEDRLALATR
jgi:hypothetical protein